MKLLSMLNVSKGSHKIRAKKKKGKKDPKFGLI